MKKNKQRFFDWKNQLVPDVRMGEKASANLKEVSRKVSQEE